jgi:hypothetical protein
MKPNVTFTFILFLALCFKARAQTDTVSVYKSPETIVIKIVESNSFGLMNNVDSKMIIVGTDNHTEIKDLKRVNFSFNGNDGIEFNTVAIKQELQKWHNSGFQVKSMSSVAAKEAVVVTTIILQKD